MEYYDLFSKSNIGKFFDSIGTRYLFFINKYYHNSFGF